MTFLPSPIPFKRRLFGDSTTDQADDAQVSEPVLTPVSELEPEADEALVESGNPGSLRLYGVAALSGAVAGAVVAVAIGLFPLRANDDPRTQQLVRDVGDLTAKVQTTTDKARNLETEAVATSQSVGAIDTRLTAASGEIDAIRTALSTLTAERQASKDTMAGVNAPALFGVAAIQLRERIEAGMPFDWELVNLRGIVGTEPTLLADLDQLAPLSATGVVTQPRLIEAMQTLVGRQTGGSLVQAGIGAVSRLLGPSVAGPAATDSQVLSAALARLAAGDLPNYLREMQGLGPQAASDARPLIVAAQRRLVALTAVQSLLRSARAGLQTQLRSVTTVVVPSKL